MSLRSHHSPRRCTPDPLGDAVRGVARGATPHKDGEKDEGKDDVGWRVAKLERELQEVRTRINALFFAVLTAALGELVGRLVLG